MKILCTGDVHIGRRPSRLPGHIDSRSLSCGECWTRIVDYAIKARADLVAVSGDLVDQDNRYYEAVGPLELGIRQLHQAGILTVMVAGNHDHSVLPWLVEGLGPDHVRLLGRGGRWERFTFERGRSAIHLDGWSFPDAHVPTSPLVDYPFRGDDLPTLGLLHADLDQPRSTYAPVGLAELRRCAPDFWLLGHIHAPRLHEEPGAARVLYPGSPQAMDPGEPGPHGVWLLELAPGRTPQCTQIPLSSVRYDSLTIDVSGASSAAELDHRITDGVRAHLRDVTVSSGPLRYLGCRVRVVGRTELHAGLEDRLRGLSEDLSLEHAGVTAFVEKVETDVFPARDLERLAQGNDAPALLARLIHSLDSGETSEDTERLLREARFLTAEIHRSRPYLQLVDDEERIELRRELRRQAVRLLDGLLSQKEVEA